MSLRVWLPLNGILENKGLSNINLNATPTYVIGGKIGNQCLASQLGWFTIPDMAEKKQMSFAYWVKINTATSTNWLDTFSWYSTDGTTSHRSRQEFYTNSTQTGVWFQGSSIGTTFRNTVGDWNHYVFTIDYDKGEAKFYINGELTNTNLAVDTTHYIKGTGSAFLLRESTLDSHINDFRLYDHILSPFEVKQISQGLILHYPLNRGGFGQENLLPNSELDGSWEYPSTSYKDWYAPVTVSIPTGSAYTLSFDAKSTVNGDKIRTHYYSPNTTTTCISSQGIIKTASDGSMDFTLSTQWERYWVVYNQNETSAVKHIICPRMVSGQGIGVVSVKNVKLEQGSIATPWCPNSSDALATTMGLNDNVEYDTSGYGNNGIKVGTFDYDSDTPKYNVSTSFNGVDNCIQLENISSLLQDVFTINLWFKKDSLGSKAYETLFGGPSGFEMDTRSGSSQTLSLYMASTRGGNVYSPFDFGEWYMVTLVNDGTNELYYVNGELVKTITKKSMPSGNYFIGAWQLSSKQNYKGLISDFRIYATALSAEDVKDLYKLGATIDTNGTLSTYEFTEQ